MGGGGFGGVPLDSRDIRPSKCCHPTTKREPGVLDKVIRKVHSLHDFDTSTGDGLVFPRGIFRGSSVGGVEKRFHPNSVLGELRLVVYPIIYKVLATSQGCKISAINSILGETE